MPNSSGETAEGSGRSNWQSDVRASLESAGIIYEAFSKQMTESRKTGREIALIHLFLPESAERTSAAAASDASQQAAEENETRAAKAKKPFYQHIYPQGVFSVH